MVGQDDREQDRTITAVGPDVGGVLAFGDRGTGRSTAVRNLADRVPAIEPGLLASDVTGFLVIDDAVDQLHAREVLTQ